MDEAADTSASKNVFTDRFGIAQMLSIPEAELLEEAPMQVVSSGLPFLYVPVRSLAAIEKVPLAIRQVAKSVGGEQRSKRFCDHDRDSVLKALWRIVACLPRR